MADPVSVSNAPIKNQVIKNYFMETQHINRRRLIRNLLLSLVIYALPVALMLLTFYIRGVRPWNTKSVFFIHKPVK